MFAKKLLHASAALFFLAAACSMGANVAKTAKPGPAYQSFGLAAHGAYAVRGRFLYRADPSGPAYRFPLPLPGTATPIACGESAGIETVILDNGDVWLWDGSNVQWRSGGSFPQNAGRSNH